MPMDLNNSANMASVKQYVCIANSTSDLPIGEKFDIAYVFSGSLKGNFYIHNGLAWEEQ